MKTLYILYGLLSVCISVRATVYQSRSVAAVVKNAADSIPLAFANVVVLNSDSSFVGGTVTDEQGNFYLKQPPSNGLVCISFIGYQTQYIPAQALPSEIYLNPSKAMLQEVTVKGQRHYVKTTSEGLTVSVDKSPMSRLGMAFDALQQMPLIDSSDGAIKVIGKGAPEIYINNQVVRNQDELKRLPASDIKDIEIITNPDVRYGSEVTCVIRIRTKKKAEGLSGTLYAWGGQNEKTSSKVLANVNYSFANGVTLFGGGDFNDNGFKQEREYHEDYRSGKIHTDSYGTHQCRSKLWHANAGMIYDFKENSVGVKYELEKTPVYNFISRSTENTNVLSVGEMTSDYVLHNPSYSHHLNAYASLALWKDATLTADADYIWSNRQAQGEVMEAADEVSVSSVLTDNENDYKLAAGKINLNTPLWGGTLDGGIQYSYTWNKQLFTTEAKGETPHLVPQKDNETQHFAAFYLSYRHGIGKYWNWKAGLRHEMTGFTYFLNDEKVDDQSKTYHNLLPHVGISYNRGKTSVGLSYQVNVNRPSYASLNNNYVYVSHTLWETGNPLLRTSLRHKMEIDLNLNRWMLNVAYYRHVRPVQSVYAYDESQQIMVRKDQNISDYNSWQFTVYKEFAIGLWHPSLQGLFAVQDLTYGTPEENYKKPIIQMVWNNRLNLPKQFYVYLTGVWLSKGYDGVSYWGGSAMMNLTCSKSVGNWSFNLTASDFLKSWRQKNTVETNGVDYSYLIKGGSCGASMSISYRFNKAKHTYRGKSAASDELDRLK